MANPPIGTIVEDFLTDLARAGKSPHTVRAYRSDLRDFGRFFTGPIERITAGVLRAYLGGLTDKAPATRARREAALAALLSWAYRAEMIAADPVTRLDRTRLPASPPRPVPTEHIEAVLRAIPTTRDRDRLLFLLLYTTGMRVGEALAIEVDDLDLSRDDEHVTVLGKGGRRRTVLLDDSTLVALLRRYLKVRGYRHGPLFRAEKTTREARCGMPPFRNSGPNTARKPRSRPRFISCATSTPPSWSTLGCPWRPSGAASDTPTPKQCFATPTNTTPPPTRRSAAGAAERSPGARTVDLPRIRTVSW